MDKEKVLDYVMNSPGNSNRAVLSGMLDESGSGDSDFSVAKLTITNNDPNYSVDIKVAHIIEINGINTIMHSETIASNSTRVFNIVLFKKNTICYIDGDIESIDDNISEMGQGNYFITGDSTITVIS